ncbi:MAG TPA: alpha/beta hydrolase [Rhizomicrobium sp.]|jgi:pimeloyl-ACP methyl ester carboxylesterase|nr:alpha/beta hydrolase [Rhizomicrobium sp.]
MATLDRDGVNIHYEVHGSGPAILLTHGYSSTAEMWSGQIAPLSANHTLILWDMRGHGRTDSPDDVSLYSEEATVADMAALLDHVGAKTAVVGGLSLGGYMSLAFHAVHPERVRALLIIDTGPGFKNDAAREDWNVYARKSADRYEREGFGTSKSPERMLAHHRTPKGLALAGRGMLTQRDARVIASLPDIKVPSLVVVGANDTGFLKAADYMQAKIPAARKIVIPDAGHAANIDQPAPFNAAVLDFLGEIGA